MEAKDILAADYKPRDAVFSARDRCDETVEHMRSVRTSKFKYIRNFLPKRPHLQPNAYKDNKTILIALRRAFKEGRLNEVQQQLFQRTRPSEELYDLESDPHEIRNLAGAPEYEDTLKSMRDRLSNWIQSTKDHGQQPETEEMFDSDMQVYLDTLKRRNPKRLPEIEANIRQMKKWAAEGK